MASPFSARRRPRKIGADDENDADVSEQSAAEGSRETGSPSITKRLTVDSTKPKKKSGLRLSFGPGQAEGEADGDSSAEVFTPKKSSLSRKAIEKNAVRKSLAPSISAERLPIRPGTTDERPSYSKDHLEELKSSTPSTPSDVKSRSAGEQDEADKLDIVSKFGTWGETPENAAIPSEGEIREKKQRRARLAKEQEYIELSDEEDDDEDSDDQEISLLDRNKKWGESRLVREDEDLGEGFDEFVEDGSITLGKKAEREQDRRRRQEMQEMINNAEGTSGSDDSDDSDAERRAQYEATQTRAGTYGSNRARHGESSRPKTPPKISPLPNLQSSLQRLQESLAKAEYSRLQKVKKMEELVRERAEIEAREVEIQRLLKEAGDNYERLRIEAGLGESAPGETSMMARHADSSGKVFENRGLESFGNTTVPALDGE